MRRFSTSGWGAAGWQQALVAVIAAIVFWPQASVNPAVGLDPSWQAGLALARIHDLAWGREVVFTLGPLGFLQTTAYYSFDQSLLATIYQMITVAALFLGIAAGLRQRYAPLTSLIAAFVTTGIAAYLCIGPGLEVGDSLGMMYPELAFLAAFAWSSVLLLQDAPQRSTVFITCLVLGAAAGFQLLVKLNSGLAVFAIALVASLLLDWRAVGRHCATTIIFVASIPIWWIFAGQRLGDLPKWLRFSAAVASGYSEAMARPLPALGLQAVPAVVLTFAWVGAICVVLVRGGAKIPRRFVLLVGLTTVIVVKSAFARLDQWHFSILLGLIVVAVIISPFFVARRRVFVVAAVTSVVLYVGVFGPFAYIHAQEALEAPAQAVDRLVTLALPGHVNQRIEQAKARQRALYAIPGRFIDSIGPGTVHIDPIEASAAWAYDRAWRPAPVFQTYAAYSPALDGLNGESLTKGPQFVLSQLSPPDAPAVGIDGRLGVQESPRYSRALLCDYTVSGVENGWALFTHTGSRCGRLTALSEVTVHENDVITIPEPSEPNAAVLAGIDLQSTAVDRLFQGTVAPLISFGVVLDGNTYRLVTKNAAEPFLVKSPPSVNSTNLQIHAHTIRLSRSQFLGHQGVTARLSFYEMQVRP
ncbi:hypothetical protein A5773_09110 [Mycobacterium sp. 852014-52450_SCH5900713]|nr:hypothetical protein A5773_09110 [Mycobacterium sp. 852014-52450_SCH5900713]